MTLPTPKTQTAALTTSSRRRSFTSHRKTVTRLTTSMAKKRRYLPCQTRISGTGTTHETPKFGKETTEITMRFSAVRRTEKADCFFTEAKICLIGSLSITLQKTASVGCGNVPTCSKSETNMF